MRTLEEGYCLHFLQFTTIVRRQYNDEEGVKPVIKGRRAKLTFGGEIPKRSAGRKRLFLHLLEGCGVSFKNLIGRFVGRQDYEIL